LQRRIDRRMGLKYMWPSCGSGPVLLLLSFVPGGTKSAALNLKEKSSINYSNSNASNRASIRLDPPVYGPRRQPKSSPPIRSSSFPVTIVSEEKNHYSRARTAQSSRSTLAAHGNQPGRRLPTHISCSDYRARRSWGSSSSACS
jgi:hypothetical protein